jgi:hypothetical protein
VAGARAVSRAPSAEQIEAELLGRLAVRVGVASWLAGDDADAVVLAARQTLAAE